MAWSRCWYCTFEFLGLSLSRCFGLFILLIHELRICTIYFWSLVVRARSSCGNDLTRGELRKSGGIQGEGWLSRVSEKIPTKTVQEHASQEACPGSVPLLCFYYYFLFILTLDSTLLYSTLYSCRWIYLFIYSQIKTNDHQQRLIGLLFSGEHANTGILIFYSKYFLSTNYRYRDL